MMIECTSIISEQRNHHHDHDDSNSSLPPSKKKHHSMAPPLPSVVQSSATIDLVTATATPPMTIPASFLCPITGRIMEDPVRDLCGHTYERRAILSYIRRSSTAAGTRSSRSSNGNGNGENCCCCPISRKPLSIHDLASNHALGERIDKWKWQQQYDALNAAARNPWFDGLFTCDVDLQGPQGGQQPQSQHLQLQQLSNPRRSEGDGDEESQPTSRTASASDMLNPSEGECDANDDDDLVSDEEEEEDDLHQVSRRGGNRRHIVDWRYWNRRRRRQQRYALLSQQQLQQQPGPAVGPAPGALLSLSLGDGSEATYSPSVSSTTSTTGKGVIRPELMLLPQELHILNYLNERSEQERRREQHQHRVRCATRCASLLAVLLLLVLAGTGVGLFWTTNGGGGTWGWPWWGTTSGAGAESGEGPAPTERDEMPENSTSTNGTTNTPLHLTYERYTLREDRTTILQQ